MQECTDSELVESIEVEIVCSMGCSDKLYVLYASDDWMGQMRSYKDGSGRSESALAVFKL